MEEPETSMPEVDDYTPEELDEYIGAHVLLPVGSDVLRAVVKKLSKGGQSMTMEGLLGLKIRIQCSTRENVIAVARWIDGIVFC